MPRLIDLSHPLEHGQLNFPADPEISVVVHSTVASIGVNMTRISMLTHHGTHLDVLSWTIGFSQPDQRRRMPLMMVEQMCECGWM